MSTDEQGQDGQLRRQGGRDTGRPVLVRFDYDMGWTVECDEGGEYETALLHHDWPGGEDEVPWMCYYGAGRYMDFGRMVDFAVKVAGERGVRVEARFEWPERVREKLGAYRAIRTPSRQAP